MTIKNIKKILYTTLLITLPLSGGEIIIDSDLSDKERATIDNLLLCGKVKCEAVWRDSDTGLMWQNEKYTDEEYRAYRKGINYLKAGNWNDARRYCRDLTYAGYSDWRLPSIHELKTLITKLKNKTRSGKSYYIRKALLSSMDSVTKVDTYWSSTSHSHYAYAWYVNVNKGNADYYNKSNRRSIRCVR